MSSVGSPGTAMTSARQPGHQAAAVVDVDELRAGHRRTPRWRRPAACPAAPAPTAPSQFCPCGIAGASVPVAIFAPGLDQAGDRLLRDREDLGRLGLQLGRRVRGVHALGQVRRGHDERAALERELLRLLAHQRRVLDAVDPGLDRGPDALVTVRVRGDPHAASVGLVDDRPQLLVGVVLRARRAGERHDTTRRAHLDQLGAVLDLVAHRLAHLADAVGDPLLDGERQHTGREARRTSWGRGDHRSA